MMKNSMPPETNPFRPASFRPSPALWVGRDVFWSEDGKHLIIPKSVLKGSEPEQERVDHRTRNVRKAMENMVDRPYLTRTEAAAYLCVSIPQLERLVRRNQIPRRKLGTHRTSRVVFRKADLDAYIESHAPADLMDVRERFAMARAYSQAYRKRP